MQTEAFLKFYTAFADDKARAQQVQDQSLQTEPSPAIAASVNRIDKFMAPATALSTLVKRRFFRVFCR